MYEASLPMIEKLEEIKDAISNIANGGMPNPNSAAALRGRVNSDLVTRES
jgi:hypothetical protein